MQLLVGLRLNSAAFFDPEGERDGQEVANVLRGLASTFEDTQTVRAGESGLLFDTNGNHVGEWRVVPLRDGD